MTQTKEQRNMRQRECMARWRMANLEAYRARNRAHYYANRMPYIARTVQQRAWAPEAVPAWLTKEHWQEIAQFYMLAQELTISTGVLHVVDHLDPVRGKDRCGLHVPWNLQVVTHARNVKKGFDER